MITFGRKLNHLRQKNHLTQKELGIALGFPEDSTDIRITQYEATTRKPLDEILVNWIKYLEYYHFTTKLTNLNICSTTTINF